VPAFGPESLRRECLRCLRYAATAMILTACASDPGSFQTLATTGAPVAAGPYSQAVIASGAARAASSAR
jgi:hypothetical protein